MSKPIRYTKKVFLVLTATIFFKELPFIRKCRSSMKLYFIPSRTIKCDYRQRQWMTKLIKDVKKNNQN